MLYYRVQSHADNTRKPGKNFDIYIANELYTETEVKKHHLNKSKLELVSIPKNRTAFVFGARKELK